MRTELFVLFAACVLAPVLRAQSPAAAGYEKGLESITAAAMMSHISFFASDSLAGRAAGTPGNTAAAHYIAERFAKLGLSPLFPSRRGVRPPMEDSLAAAFRSERTDTLTERAVSGESRLDQYFQNFTVKRSRLSDEQHLSLRLVHDGASLTYRYDYRTDFLIQAAGAPRSQTITGPVVFAGYGIDEGEDGYNDYAGRDGKPIDVRERIVVVVDGFPRESDPLSSFSRSRKPVYRNPLRKAEVAARHGAVALLVVGSPLRLEPSFLSKYDQISRAFGRETDHLAERIGTAIPIIYVASNVAADLFSKTGERLDSLIGTIERTLRPGAFPLPDRELSLDIAVRSQSFITRNVAGLIEGSDPALRGQVLVIGAHYDHVGLGYTGTMNRADTGKVHFGADDNASGTSAMLEIAEAIAQKPLKRSVLILAFSGEENGLLGSRYYVTVQPLRPLDSTVAMLNCDMVGRNEPELLWIGGAFYSDDLRSSVEEANREAGTRFELLYNVGLLTSASDQGPFLRHSIPALFFFSGLHEDYHTPGDVVGKIDGEKSARVAKLAYMTAWNVGNSPARPRYREISIEERAALSRESKARLDRIRPPLRDPARK